MPVVSGSAATATEVLSESCTSESSGWSRSVSDHAHDLRIAVGEELRALRTTAGISKAELGRKAGVSSAFIAGLESGAGNPSFFRVARVAASLGVPLSSVIERAQERLTDGDG